MGEVLRIHEPESGEGNEKEIDPLSPVISVVGTFLTIIYILSCSYTRVYGGCRLGISCSFS
jgi:hypothetical protein